MNAEPRRVLAPNPGLFTLEGTNTWIVGSGPTAVIDPGPDDAGHIAAVAREAGQVAVIILSHRHPDHAPGAGSLSAMTGAPIRAYGPLPGEDALADGEDLTAGDAILTAIHTPGHTPDHIVVHDRRTGALFTGDAVLGRGTSVIDPPEGDLTDYLRSLDVMLALRPTVIYPGHGPVVPDAVSKLQEYRRHRAERERQVMRELAAGPATPEDLVPGIYAAYPRDLFPIAARSILAHLLKLEREHRVRRTGLLEEDRFELA